MHQQLCQQVGDESSVGCTQRWCSKMYMMLVINLPAPRDLSASISASHHSVHSSLMSGKATRDLQMHWGDWSRFDSRNGDHSQCTYNAWCRLFLLFLPFLLSFFQLPVTEGGLWLSTWPQEACLCTHASTHFVTMGSANQDCNAHTIKHSQSHLRIAHKYPQILLWCSSI